MWRLQRLNFLRGVIPGSIVVHKMAGELLTPFAVVHMMLPRFSLVGDALWRGESF
jgi:hypothetical protein